MSSTLIHHLWKNKSHLKKLESYARVHTKSKLILSLLKYLMRSTASSPPSKESIYQYLYPKQVFNDLKFRQLIHRLQMLDDDFQIHLKSRQQQVDHLLLIHSKNTPKESMRIRRKIALNLPIDSSIFQYRYQLYVALEEQAAIQTKGDRTKEPNYQMVNDRFDHLFLIEKLKITCGALSYASLNQFPYDFTFIESMEEYMNHYIQPSMGLLYLLYKTYRCHKYNLEEEFFALMNYLQQNTIHKNEETDLILRMAGNFAIRKINQGQAIYFEHLFNVYDVTLRNNCLIDENGHISFNTFLNVLTTALRLKKFEWTENFLNSNLNHLPEEEKETGSLYLKARYHFELEQYNQSLQLLSQSDPKDFFQSILFRVLQIKALYESDETELVDIYLENYRLYLLRHKSNTYHYKLQSSFIQYLKKINRMRSATQKTTLFNKLSNERQVAEKQWLLSILS